jgi:Domain of unknown function (DUF4111)
VGFREGLLTSLGSNLIGAYLHGSIAFPEFEPRGGDIDFYVVVNRPLNGSEVTRIDRLHRFLATEFEFGSKLDGFYISNATARRQDSPKRLVYATHGRIHHGGLDDAWALHREHFAHSVYIRLYGPSAARIFPRAGWPQIRSALYRQLVYVRKIIDTDPWWSVLNLCRLVYDFKTGRVVVSKLGAARWASKVLPSRWRPVIYSAIKAYKSTADRKARMILRGDAREFLGFASIRVIAFDIASNSRLEKTPYLRKSLAGTRK